MPLQSKAKAAGDRLSKLNKASEELRSIPEFDQTQHDSESRKEITKLFLKWYFCLIAGAFAFCAIYNFVAAKLNLGILKAAHDLSIERPELLTYLEVSNTVAIITTTLSSGVGFVIGYYFKNKGES